MMFKPRLTERGTPLNFYIGSFRIILLRDQVVKLRSKDLKPIGHENHHPWNLLWANKRFKPILANPQIKSIFSDTSFGVPATNQEHNTHFFDIDVGFEPVKAVIFWCPALQPKL